MILFNRSRILKLCVINVLTNRLIFSDVIVCIIFSGGWGVGEGEYSHILAIRGMYRWKGYSFQAI